MFVDFWFLFCVVLFVGLTLLITCLLTFGCWLYLCFCLWIGSLCLIVGLFDAIY